MNERIKELAEQAGFYKYGSHFEEIIERFAELVRQDYLRELKALKPVAWVDWSMDGSQYSDTETSYGTPLYSLDGEQA